MAILIISKQKKLTYKWLRFPVTHLGEVDEQHQALLKLMNLIRKSLRNEGELSDFKQNLRELRKHLTQHFEYEEQRMLARGYPDFSPHLEEHEKFLSGALFETIRDTQGQERFDIHAIIHWKAEHITEFDKPMAEYLLTYS